jgi:hypothetical protein
VLNDKTERQIRGLPEEPEEQIQDETDAAQILGLEPGAEPAEGPAEAPAVDTVPVAPAPQQLAQPEPGRGPV